MSGTTSLVADSIPVRVVVRIRPLIPLEIETGAEECVTVNDKSNSVFVSDRSFAFDFVFGTKCTQDFVYEESVRDLLNSSFSGYNTTIFAYGQTGSGKTYTMGTGADDGIDEDKRGILPRMITDIFNKLDADTEVCAMEGTSYEIYASFAEIYNEKVFDLLNNRNESLSIVNNGDTVIVKGLSERRVYKTADMFKLLHDGSESRRIGATEMNKQSSRSHAIFTITICKVTANEGTLRGKLNFVDLAGSERLEKTKATGSRAQEGISINKSLSTLSKVIEALVTHASHVPYRESALTRLLKDSLGGNAKTVMIACVSPADSNLSETVNTLRWADQARKIENKPVVNMDPTTAEILKLKKRISDLEEIISNYESGSSFTVSSSPSEGKQRVLVLEEEVKRLRSALLKSESELRSVHDDMSFILEQKKGGDAMQKLLDEKNKEIERLKQQSTLSMIVPDIEIPPADEECPLVVDEADQAQLDTLTEQESHISALLQSKQQIQSLKEKYEEKLIQISSQLELLTKENHSLHQMLTEAEKKGTSASNAAHNRELRELRRKLKKNELTTQQLQKWKEEYNRIIGKYKEKEIEVRELQTTLKQVQAERIRFQKDVAKKAHQQQLEQRKRELEESKKRLRDRKEQKSLEKQIRHLEIQLSHEKEKAERERRSNERERPTSRVVIGVDKSILEKQTLGLLRHEMLVDTLNRTIKSYVDKRTQLQRLIESIQQELESVSDISKKKLLSDRLFHLNQDKAILTARITRLNRRLSLSSSSLAGTRWSAFISVDQLRVVCDVLLCEMLKKNQQLQKEEEEVQKLASENKDLVEQLKKEESKTAFLLSKVSIPASVSKKSDSTVIESSSDGSLLDSSQLLNDRFDKDASRLGEFLQNQLELYHDEKQLLQMELEEEKTMRSLAPLFHRPAKPLEPLKPSTGTSKPSVGPKSQHSVPVSKKLRHSTDLSSTDSLKSAGSRSLSPPQTTELKKRSIVGQENMKRRRTESSEGMRTPPSKSKPELTIQNYSCIERERGFEAYKREKPILQMLPSLDDLQLPKLPSLNDTKALDGTVEYKQREEKDMEPKKATHKRKSKEEREKLARKQESEINLLLTETDGCHCKGKCSNRKCPCRNYGKACSIRCSCNKDKCINSIQEYTPVDELEETVVESS